MMRAAFLVTALCALTACTGWENNRIISDVGGEKFILANGVCIKVDEIGEEEDSVFRVAPSNCEVQTQ